MNDDELKKLWQQQPLRNPDISAEKVISAMQNKTTQLRRVLGARDLRELWACAFVIIIFGVFYFTSYRTPISRLGDLIVIGSSIFIAWKLVRARRTTPPAPPGATIVESLRAELNAVRTQSQLLGSILWWYLLPLGIGILVCAWGSPGGGLGYNIGYTIFVVALYAFIYRLNQWARSKQLLPVEAQLESLLHSADTGEPLDQTSVANLRPIVLSMAAASQVKPAEFKVAFWQLALYGEIAAIGFWFFLMLGLTEGTVSLIFNWPHLVLIVPFFLAGLLYSWLLQKLTERAVGISNLGVHLHKGQNLILWDEIKEVRPFRILNIRSLWLIRESGEKTITAWTSLERHSDLKAAVESFAPANHPLRRYLSLLSPEPPKKNIMTKTILIGIVLISLGAIVFVRGREPKTPAIEYSDPSSQMLEVIRKKYDFPALAVVVVKDGKVCDRAAVGVRKSGDETLVTTNDQFHIGSCTKSMTATLAAMFIEEGKLRWDTTVAEVFPGLKSKMDKRYEDVTVEQLLTHQGGVPGKPPGAAWRRAWKEEGTPMEQRQEFIAAVLAAPPEAAPGKKKIYSNQGYTIVGGMLEKIADKPWEELITEKLFKPLHMDSAGFGPPGTTGKLDQPWGHISKLFTTIPVQGDNPPAIGPAGRVHCSLDDLARYAMFHLEGERDGKLLKPETFRKLHTEPRGGDYACGWVCVRRGWAGGRALMHNGSNTMWYVVMWLAPEKDFAVIAATNTGATEGPQGLDDVAVAMIEKWLGVTP